MCVCVCVYVCMCVCVGCFAKGLWGSVTQGNLPSDAGTHVTSLDPQPGLLLPLLQHCECVSVCVCLHAYVSKKESCLFLCVFQHSELARF